MLHISLLESLKADLNRLIESQNTILIHRCRDTDFEHGQRIGFIKALHIVLNKEQYIKENPDIETIPTYSFKEEKITDSISQTYKIDV